VTEDLSHARSIAEVRVAVSARAQVGECPRWDDELGRLLWIDISAHAVHAFDPVTGVDTSVQMSELITSVNLTTDRRVLVGHSRRFALVDLCTGATETALSLEHLHPSMSTNDAACDSDGRLWFGTVAHGGAMTGGLFRFEGGDESTPMVSQVEFSNGLGWSPDGRLLYYADSARGVDILDFDIEHGVAANRRPFVLIPAAEGKPDGLAVDDEGGVWIALWGAGKVRRYKPDGSLDGHLNVPVGDVTACAFGGDDHSTLFITSASARVDAQAREPLAGNLFAADVPFTGPSACRYRVSLPPSELNDPSDENRW